MLSQIICGILIWLGVIIPMAHNSDDPLFRQPIIPTAHCSAHKHIIHNIWTLLIPKIE